MTQLPRLCITSKTEGAAGVSSWARGAAHWLGLALLEQGSSWRTEGPGAAVYLHCLAMAQADTFALSKHDVILHVVPMFHANAWCVPYAGLMVGATQIFAGPHPQPRDLVDLKRDYVS